MGDANPGYGGYTIYDQRYISLRIDPLRTGAYNLYNISACAKRVWPRETSRSSQKVANADAGCVCLIWRMDCHATTGPPGPPMAAAAGPLGPTMAPWLDLLCHSWSPMIQHCLPLKNV